MNLSKKQYTMGAIALGVVLLGVALATFWGQKQQALEDAMADRLYQAHTGWAAERQASKVGEFDAAQAQTLYPKTIAALESIDRDGKDSAAAQDARLWLGQIFLRHGQADRALPYYEKAVARAHGGLEKSMCLQGLAIAQEAQGQKDVALKTLDQALPGADPAVQPEVLLHVARLAISLGQKDRAGKTLSQILEKHPATQWAQEAQRLKLELDGTSGAGAAQHG